MGEFEDRMFLFLEEWFQPIGLRIEAIEKKVGIMHDNTPLEPLEPLKPLVMPEALKEIMKDDVRRYIKNTYIDGFNNGVQYGKTLI
ncbi:unnamed protein product [marine sediment metagenome]|uniref:Uncharacterized protein n=1 Tax=marine sediment metagenome TaxID=412755 RepID=X1HP22_9ZZZZ